MRGDLYRLRAPREARGHEQHGARFAVVLQADELSALSTWIVAPTSTRASERSFRPAIDIDGTVTRIVVDQMTAVDHLSCLGDFAGRLSAAELIEVDRATRVVMGLT
ncbi:MAG: type II toxin-antitoxin system PemK/MazF family toxin [Pseudonocardia sp.]